MKELRTWGDLWFWIKNRKWPDRKEFEYVLEKRWEMEVLTTNSDVIKASSITPDSDEYCGKDSFNDFLEWFIESDNPHYIMYFDNGNKRVYLKDSIICINIISKTKKVKKEKQLNG